MMLSSKRRNCNSVKCLWTGLLVAVVSVVWNPLVVNASAIGRHEVPVFTWKDLKYGNRDEDLKEVLTTTGLLSIDMSDNHDSNNHNALKWLCDCSSELHQLEGGESRRLNDGKTIRSTLASATMGLDHPQRLPKNKMQSLTCSDDNSLLLESLRDDVSTHSQLFIQALDRILPSSLDQQQRVALMETSHGKEYHSVHDIVAKSHNLEHFHVYTNHDNNSDDAAYVDSALKSHIDAGLFLAFVPAMNCRNSYDNEDDDSFRIHLSPHEASQPVSFQPGTMAIMLGAGAEYWLSSPLPLKATRHSVQMKPGTKRSWYGMMHLVPKNAIIEKYPEPKTFADMRSSMALTSDNKNTNDSAVTLGCGHGSPFSTSQHHISNSPSFSNTVRRRVEMVDDASACNNSTNFYCWMVCQDIPDSNDAQSHVDQDQSLYCLDPAVLYDTNSLAQAVQSCSDPVTGTPGGAMDAACVGKWEKTDSKVLSQPVKGTSLHPHHPTDNTHKMSRPYCFGGTSMLMGGFEWESNTCIVYLFPKWVISTRLQMILACIGTLFAGMALEGIIAGRRYVTTQLVTNGTQKLFSSALFYMLQLTLGYLLMLVVMTYSGPLFMSVILGIISGHIVFNFAGRNNNLTTIPEGSTPCCQNDLGNAARCQTQVCSKNNVCVIGTDTPDTVCSETTQISSSNPLEFGQDLEENFKVDTQNMILKNKSMQYGTTDNNELSDDEEFLASLPPCCQPKR